MNNSIKMSNVRILVSFFATSIIVKFAKAPAKGEKLDTKTCEIHRELSFDFSALPQNIFADCKASRHGLKQKLVDSLAMNKDVKETTSIGEAADSLMKLWEQLLSGEWNAASRAGTKGTTVKISDMEKMFLDNIKKGLMDKEAAINLYAQLSGGKTLVVPEETEELEEENEQENEDQP